MPHTLSGWRLHLLGSPQVVAADGRIIPCERKTAALLAYLALEGRTSRATLVKLLWPDTLGEISRNNLVQHLRRLNKACGVDLVLPGEEVELDPAVEVDVQVLLGGQGRGISRAELLDGVELDGCPDLLEWLETRREGVHAAAVNACQVDIRSFEEQGSFTEAIGAAQALLELDPVVEDAWRDLMRLHLLNGDRAAALGVYHRCKDVLMRELGVEPTAETRRLARAIGEGTVGAQGRSCRIPVAVLRPPALVGREEAWARIEEAWADGKGIALIGEAGSGKTRLATDFMRSRPDHQVLFFGGRPGDRQVPYATHTRFLSALLEAAPNCELPGWVRRELARTLPVLGEAPPPIRSDTDKRRFYEATVEFIRRVTQRAPMILGNDDMHFMDDASMESGTYVASHFVNDGVVLRNISCYQSGALSPFAQAIMQRAYEAGVLVPIHLAPLAQGDIEQLLSDLGLSQGTVLADDFARASGGNPQVVLELLKGMYQTGTFQVATSTRGAPSVAALITGRFERLSASSQQVARAAAVLRRDFTVEQVARMLGASLLDVASAWEELEEAQVMSGEAFSHDLMLQTILAGIPSPVLGVLHRAAAHMLGAQGGAPARIASHWQEGGDPGKAAPWFLRAGEAAEATLRFAEAEENYARAQLACETVGDTEGAARARRTRVALAERLPALPG
ncbi:ATP-binding protein [Deinococcus apachensis]|uniref:ATP-binding protein n=1 Tax=Deinococcus apachensis TaxID=309886 RepID=UPI000369B83D|nr:BTAD domain-containing putative transcriptional regulator [Deinococcus apachensis]